MTKDTTPSGVREAVARIIYDKLGYGEGDPWDYAIERRARNGLGPRRAQIECLDTADAILALVGGGAGEGWRMVPVAPTRQMIMAAIDRPDDPEADMYTTIYRAMITAAPAPPVHVGGGEIDQGVSRSSVDESEATGTPSPCPETAVLAGREG